MPGTRWFSHVDMGASYPSEPLLLEEIERVLDTAQPANIDAYRSNAVDGSFVIAYSPSFLGDIEIEVWEDWADLKSVVLDRQIRALEHGPDWVQEIARTVDRIIRGHYKIDRTRWRDKIIKTDVRSTDSSRTIQTGWSRLPIPNRFLTHERVQLDYGCASGGASSDRPAGAS